MREHRPYLTLAYSGIPQMGDIEPKERIIPPWFDEHQRATRPPHPQNAQWQVTTRGCRQYRYGMAWPTTKSKPGARLGGLGKKTELYARISSN